MQLDDAAGFAVIESSTPFSRDFERGLIMGGMLAPGDLWYVKVDHDDDPHRFVITFRPTVSLADRAHRGEVPGPDQWNPDLRTDSDWVDPLYWRYQGLLEGQRRNHRFWDATNRTLERLAQQLHDISRRMEDLAHQDSLTALTNRGGIIELLEQEYARSVRYDAALSVGILDLDWFKKINDTHGHLAGDEVLRNIAKILAETLRLSDSIGRLSGEEFLLIFPGTTAIEAAQAANKLREKVAQIDFPCENGCFRVTASFGVADRTADTEHMTELLRRADYALYKAKKAGRNRVERFS